MNCKENWVEKTWQAWSEVWDMAAFAATDEEKAKYGAAAALLREAYDLLRS